MFNPANLDLTVQIAVARKLQNFNAKRAEAKQDRATKREALKAELETLKASK